MKTQQKRMDKKGTRRASSKAAGRVFIFDTTLRDGEQSPGCSMTLDEKLLFAAQLAKLRVDVIEAGFPIASKGDYNAVQAISKEIQGPIIAGLARAIKKDVDTLAEALEPAKKGRIHTFIGTSPTHLAMMGATESKCYKMATDAVALAKSYRDDVEFSAMDASRSDRRFLYDILEATIEAGATTINIPDTVGYAIPDEFAALIGDIKANVKNISRAVISVHCHNDLGLAVANSIAAVQAGARQVELAVNGIGERAGNAALEEFVMALKTRRDFLKTTLNVNAREIYKASKLLVAITGSPVQPNKAIVGANAFAHEAGIHQDGFLKERSTFEIMKPTSIGIKESKLVLGKHSGRHAFRKRLEELNYKLTDSALDRAFERFKDLADKKKEIFDEDLDAIAREDMGEPDRPVWELVGAQTLSGSKLTPTATVSMRRDGSDPILESATGDGPVDALFKAIEKVTNIHGKLLWYDIRSVSVGKDAIGEATARVEIDKEVFLGKGASTDIIEASAKAWVSALNRHASAERIRNGARKRGV